MLEDLTGKSYFLEVGVHCGSIATITGKDNLFPDEDRWLVAAHGHTWGVSGLALRNVIKYQQETIHEVCP